MLAMVAGCGVAVEEAPLGGSPVGVRRDPYRGAQEVPCLGAAETAVV